MGTRRRLWCGAVALGVVAVLLPVTGAIAAEPTLQRVAGAIGEGVATSVGQRPKGLAIHGTTLYIADGDGTNVVRALDLTTGRQRIVAGNTAGARLDNVPATDTMLYEPQAVVTDAAGSLYILEGATVRKVGAAGTISTVVGQFSHKPIDGVGDGGPATGARLSSPNDMTFDAAGNLYIADYFNHRVRKVDTNGVITTVAGDGTAGFGGDGGPATEARLNRPNAVAVDAAGNLYIADFYNYRVRKVDPSGTITTFAGTGTESSSGDGGPATGATFVWLEDLAVDRYGNLFIADQYGYRIRRVDTGGTITTFAGGHGDGTAGDGGPATSASVRPSDLLFDATGNLYYTDAWNDKVRRIDLQGIITTVAGNGHIHSSGDGGPAVDAQTHGMQRLAVDPVTGNLAFADTGTGRVRTISPSGVVSTVWVGPKFSFWIFSGMAYDPWGNLYVGERSRIRRIDRNGGVTVVAGTGESGFSGDGGLATDARIKTPSSMTFDRAGNLYFSDMHNARIRKVSTLGIISTVVGSGVEGLGGDGGPATSARIMPWYGAEVAFDSAGNLYLADSYNDRIRKVDASGTITSVGAGLVKFPTGLAFDGAGNLFVASAQDNRVRKMTPAGAWSTVAGNGTYGFGREGAAATSTELALMYWGMGGDVVVDGNGTLFIGGWQRIWEVDGVATAVTLPVPPSSSTTSTSTSTSSTSSTTTTTRPPRTVAWGLNHAGQAGLADSGGVPYPRGVSGNPEGQTAVAAGWYHSLAVNAGGTVSGWGWNQYGQVGDGSIDTQLAPIPVSGLTGVTAVSAGVAHSLALKSDGTVWSWGLNMFGQLGDGTAVDRRTPVRVPGLTGVVAVSAGAYHSLALKSDGTVWAWGWNGKGGLGDGTLAERRSPVAVSGLSGVSSIAAGGYHSLASVADGSVRAWGWNPVGQLGTGATVDSALPVTLPGLTGVRRVAAGLYHSLALRTDGTVRAWGWNALGQLGDGTTTDRWSPVTATGVTEATALTAGFAHSLAIRSTGDLVAWGWNTYGQLGVGDGSGIVYPLVTPVAMYRGFRAVAAGATHTVAILNLT